MNRLATNFFRYIIKKQPNFYGIPFNEQYECKDFYLKTIPLKNDVNNSVNNTNSIVIRKINDKIIPYKKQYECRDF